MKINNNFGPRLKMLRKEKGLTGTEFGKLFNFSRSGVSNWEARTREPSQAVLKEIADYFEVSVDYLIGVSDVRSPNIIANEDVKGFTAKLVEQLIKEKMIKDIDHIPDDIVNMVISALKYDLRQNKKR